MIDTTNTKASSGDAFSDSEKAGSSEVTPAMIDAGVSVLWESGAVETPMEGADQELIQKIFVAMSHVSKQRS